MRNRSVVFIAFEERENLGIGYLASVLAEAGFKIYILDFRKDLAEILKDLQSLDPLIVGFSVIFEYHIFEFRDLINSLREKHVNCHFTAGGLFGSLKPDELFQLIPTLDSIVRFEGENTMLSLANYLGSGKDWRSISGLSYKQDESVIHNPFRSLEPDLDHFPLPIRPDPKKYALETTYATLLAGRGCVHDCTFCNIRDFYGQPPGPQKRVRDPLKVVEEIEYLYLKKGVEVFLFEDDDFPVIYKGRTEWVKSFCVALDNRNLTGKIMWKINCRPDEIDPYAFDLMQQHGLFRVYLGIDDGTDLGLSSINKKMKVSDHLKGIQILKALGIEIDYGFMLFQPDTSYSSLNENLEFLELICKDGYMPAAFMKMMPFMGTRIECELREQGRLKGKPGFFDYDFLEKSLDDFYAYTMEGFDSWINLNNGYSNAAKWAANFLSVYAFFNRKHAGIQKLEQDLRTNVSTANSFLISTMKELSGVFQSGQYLYEKDPVLSDITNRIENTHSDALKEIDVILAKTEMYHLTRGIFAYQ